MFKFLLILFLVGYVVMRIGGFIFKIFASGLSNGQRQGNYNSRSQSNQTKRKAPGSNLNIDHVPKSMKDTGKSSKGGEYVDYEEVK